MLRNMSQKMKNKKKEIITFLIILMSGIITCFIYLRFHAITDTYWNIQVGYKEFGKIALSDGRLMNWASLNLANMCKIPIEKYIVLSHISATIINSISVYLIYNYLLDVSKAKKYKFLLLIGAFLIIFNQMNLEQYAYTENAIMAFSMFLCVNVAIIINKKQKYYIPKSVILVILAAISYQGTLNLFVTLSICFMLTKEQKQIKYYIKDIIIIIVLALVALLTIYGSVLIINNVMNLETARVENKISNIFSMIRWIVLLNLFVDFITIESYNLFLEGLTAYIILASILILAYQQKPIKKITKYLGTIFVAIVSCIAPILLMSVPSISARMSCSIGAIAGISIIFVFTNSNMENKLCSRILTIIAITLMSMNLFAYWNNGMLNIKVMKYEQVLAKQIGAEIEEYEKKNNIVVNNIVFCSNGKPTNTYENMKKNTFTDRALACSYSRIHCLNYYLEKDYKEIEPKVDIEYFKDYKADHFEPRQVRFKDDIAYVYIINENVVYGGIH